MLGTRSTSIEKRQESDLLLALPGECRGSCLLYWISRWGISGKVGNTLNHGKGHNSGKVEGARSGLSSADQGGDSWTERGNDDLH
jgi:hypothetical protein